MTLYIGLISGTSMDGVDAAIVNFTDDDIKVVAALTHEYPDNLRNLLKAAIRPGHRFSLAAYGKIDVEVGRAFADAVTRLLSKAGMSSHEIAAIGSHGQTLHHSPDGESPFTIQIGNPSVIANNTGITTIADFRSMDVAAGGQGAPLVPPFHNICFRTKDKNTVVLNIGGIANITVLPADPSLPASGFDTGPGNCLMDEWVFDHRQTAYDKNGMWAASGTIDEHLLYALLKDTYFTRPAPKSTGREYFNRAWLAKQMSNSAIGKLAPQDVQATLNELTARSITDAIRQLPQHTDRIIVCGGGAHNGATLKRMSALLPQVDIHTSAEFNIDPEMIEASAFAWLAMQRDKHIPTRLQNGATSTKEILGATYLKI